MTWAAFLAGIELTKHAYDKKMENDYASAKERSRSAALQLIEALKADTANIKKLYYEKNGDVIELFAIPQIETHDARMYIIGRFLDLRKKMSATDVELTCCFEDSGMLRDGNLQEI